MTTAPTPPNSLVIRDRIRGLARLPAARVKPHPKNARRHDERQRTVLRALLADVGVVGALLVVPADPEALQALRAAEGEQGFSKWLKGYKGSFLLADGHMRREEISGPLTCLVLDLDAREMAEVLALLDPIGALARTDAALLDELAKEAGPLGDEVTKLLGELCAAGKGAGAGDGEEEEPAVDPTDAILEKWKTAAGDLWIVPSLSRPGEEHRVLCGDARNPEDVARLMGDRRAKLGQHDPPYGVAAVDRGIGSGKREGNSTVPRGKFRPIEGDRDVFNPTHLLGSADRVILWGANNFPALLDPSNGWIVWDKKATADGGRCAEDVAFGDAELAWVSFPRNEGRVRLIPHLWSGMYRASEKGDKRLAPTQKPIFVISQPIEWWTEPGDLVTDWYCGSGTTGVACEKLGRIAALMELTPRYTAVTLERLSRLGLHPRLAA